jgi:uncharacterized membrane protein YbhN (UPF0104 family)
LQSTDESPSRGGKLRQAGFLGVRVVIAVVLCTWLVRSGRLDLADIGALDPGAREFLWMGAAMCGVSAGLLLLAVRMRWLLSITGIRISLRRSFRVIVLGLLSSILLPGQIGGDVVRATVVCQGLATGRRRAIGTIVVDRIVGILALFWIAALAALLGALSGALPELPPIVTALPWVICLGSPVGLYLLVRLVPRFADRLPAGWMGRLQPLTLCLSELSRRPRTVLGALALGIVNHGLVLLTYVAADGLLGHPSRLLDHLVLDPLAMAMNALPISPGGLGVSESLFSYLYGAIGHAEGASIGVLGRGMQYVVYAVVGGLALVVSRDESGRVGPVA